VTPIVLPTTTVNADTGILTSWRVDDRARVEAGHAIADVETSKAVIEVEAPGTGYVLQAAAVGDQVSVATPFAYVFDSLAELDQFKTDFEKARETQAAAAATRTVQATKQAEQRAKELGVDLAALHLDRLITTQDVEAAAVREHDYSSMPLPLTAAAGLQRLMLIGGAYGATQVLDILRGSETQAAVAVLDDLQSLWGTSVSGIPIVGGVDRLQALHAGGAFDAVVIAVGTSVPARVKLRKRCESLGIPLANVIDRSSVLLSDVKIGTGNVICAMCHFGNSTIIGDNNFISARASIDHHNVLGSDFTMGPNVVTSGLVTIGNRVKFGMGVHVEPRVEIGDDAQIASGSVILTSVPPKHAVKTKIITTVTVPIRTASSR
jgi:acetyltransferase-like isoleucine patch superfamily enzyme